MVELKHCPFCKGQNINIIACYDDVCDDVDCEGCDKVQYSVVCDALRGGCGAACGWQATKEDAITAWNTRIPEKDVNNEP